MPLPSQVHRQAALEQVSMAYRNTGLISDRLATSVPVQHEADQYYVYSQDSLILPETLRAMGAAANRASFSLSLATYQLQEHALGDLVPDRKRRNSDKAINLDVDTTEYLTEKILMRRELAVSDLVGTRANWSNITSLTSTFAWSQNTTLSNPIQFVDSAATVIARGTGKLPNVVALDFRTFQAAKEHTNLTDRIKFTSSDSVSEQLMAKLFNVDEVLVARGIRNTSEEGLETTTGMNFMWTDGAFVAYVEKSPGLKRPSALLTFTQTEGGNPYKVKKWRDDERDGDVIEVSTLFQTQSPASLCAYFIADTVQ